MIQMIVGVRLNDCSVVNLLTMILIESKLTKLHVAFVAAESLKRVMLLLLMLMMLLIRWVLIVWSVWYNLPGPIHLIIIIVHHRHIRIHIFVGHMRSRRIHLSYICRNDSFGHGWL